MTKVLNGIELERLFQIPIWEVARQNCTVESLTIPEGYKEVEAETFYQMRNLKTITLPSTLKTINVMAFKGCKNLTEINCASPIVKVERWAFNGCENLKTINMNIDFEYEDIISRLFAGVTPKTLKTFKLGKMVVGQVVSRTYIADPFSAPFTELLPETIRLDGTRKRFNSTKEDEQ